MELSAAEIRQLQPTTLFARQAPDAFTLLVGEGRLTRSHKGDTLFVEEDPGDVLWLVANGWVRQYCNTLEGDEKVLGYRGRGALVGESILLGRTTHTVSAQAYVDSDLLVLDLSRLQGWLSREPSLLRELLKVMAIELERCRQDLVTASSYDVRGRLLRAVVMLARRYGEADKDGSCRLTLPMSFQELAALIGSTRETVSRLCGGISDIHMEHRTLGISNWAEFQALHA